MRDAAQDLEFGHPPTLTGRIDPVLGEHAYDFYRCQRCQRVITLPQLQRALQRRDELRICPCGGLKFSPTNLVWYEYLLPRVLAFAWQRARELGVTGIVANARGQL